MTLMVAIAVLLSFYLAFNLGANDVANAMGTAVGAKSLTLRQALVVAGVLELTGAVVFGQGVSDRLITGIVDPAAYAPLAFLQSMFAVLIASGIWINVATLKGWPVSSSHAVVGAIVGVGLVNLGPSAVQWSAVGLISVTWILTPLASGLVAMAVYRGIQGLLDRADRLGEWLPWLSLLLMGVLGLLLGPVLGPLLGQNLGSTPIQTAAIGAGLASFGAIGLCHLSWSQVQQPERIFQRFQVISACAVAFAHGSNDVGNAIAPLAAILQVSQGQAIGAGEIPRWILALGGLGLVTGLAVLGGRVIATIGEGITELTPSQGFCAELATATVVLLASQAGLPVSTSHALVGGVVGISIVRQGLGAALQLPILRTIAAAWTLTIPIAAGLAMGVNGILRLVWN
jgi:inorganic phosphate transporter, PiT family